MTGSWETLRTFVNEGVLAREEDEEHWRRIRAGIPTVGEEEGRVWPSTASGVGWGDRRTISVNRRNPTSAVPSRDQAYASSVPAYPAYWESVALQSERGMSETTSSFGLGEAYRQPDCGSGGSTLRRTERGYENKDKAEAEHEGHQSESKRQEAVSTTSYTSIPISSTFSTSLSQSLASILEDGSGSRFIPFADPMQLGHGSQPSGSSTPNITPLNQGVPHFSSAIGIGPAPLHERRRLALGDQISSQSTIRQMPSHPTGSHRSTYPSPTSPFARSGTIFKPRIASLALGKTRVVGASGAPAAGDGDGSIQTEECASISISSPQRRPRKAPSLLSVFGPIQQRNVSVPAFGHGRGDLGTSAGRPGLPSRTSDGAVERLAVVSGRSHGIEPDDLILEPRSQSRSQPQSRADEPPTTTTGISAMRPFPISPRPTPATNAFRAEPRSEHECTPLLSTSPKPLSPSMPGIDYTLEFDPFDKGKAPEEIERLMASQNGRNDANASAYGTFPTGSSPFQPACKSSHADRQDGVEQILPGGKARGALYRLLTLSNARKAILKCSLAYFLASLFTFVPMLSSLLSTSSEIDVHGRVTKRPAYSAHMVATIVVYYHPARSVGSMILADKYCAILATASATVSIISMLTLKIFDYYYPKPGTFGFEAGNLVVLFVLIGPALGALAWTKQWVNNPGYNTGCSMAAVILFIVVVKEGGWDKLTEVLLIVLIGASISNVVCYTFAPVSATTRLQGSISTSLDSFKTLFSLLSATFLLDPSLETQTSLEQAITAHSAAFTKLKADLAEAQHESIFDRRINRAQKERFSAVIDSLTRLAQHLNGLRGGIDLQTRLLEAQDEEERSATSSDQIMDYQLGSPTLEEIADMVETFMQFRDEVGDSMRELCNACCSSLLELQGAFDAKEDGEALAKRLQAEGDRIRQKLNSFKDLSLTTIRRLYGAIPDRENEILSDEDLDRELKESEDDVEPNDAIFLIYFFVFTLEEFVREQLELNDAMRSLLQLRSRSFRESVTRWLTPSGSVRDVKSGGPNFGHASGIKKRFAKLIPLDPSDLQPAPFPQKDSVKAATLTLPERQTLRWTARWSQSLWSLQDRLLQPDIKYAAKTAFGTIILASPAFIDRYRPIFLEYRGEWSLIAYWASMSMTIGGTNFLMAWRVLGTTAGAVFAVFFYTLFPDNPIVLPILGFFFSIPCFWVITQRPAYQQAARFVLLTYNLTCLYSYNRREEDVEAFTVGWQRMLSIIIGTCWAGVVSNVIWPYAARKELRLGLSDFCLDLAYLYGRLVKQFSGELESSVLGDNLHDREQASADASALIPATRPHIERDHSAVIQHFMQMELHLQLQLIHLRGLLAQTKNEPRLKGPFPVAVYDEMLTACQSIVDRFHSMRCATTRQDWDANVLEDFIRPVNPQRREMVSNVILYLYIISSSLRLRTPLPPILPPAELSRRRLAENIKNLDVVKRKMTRSDQRCLGYWGFTVAMQGVIASLEDIGEEMQALFGVLGEQSRTDFERMFA